MPLQCKLMSLLKLSLIVSHFFLRFVFPFFFQHEGFEPKGSGSAKKRVAKMDKVLNDIRRFSKINEEMEKTGDDALPPLQSDLEVTPQRPLGKFYIRRDLHQ